jgi:hypothetical protein
MKHNQTYIFSNQTSLGAPARKWVHEFPSKDKQLEKILGPCFQL